MEMLIFNNLPCHGNTLNDVRISLYWWSDILLRSINLISFRYYDSFVTFGSWMAYIQYETSIPHVM